MQATKNDSLPISPDLDITSDIGSITPETVVTPSVVPDFTDSSASGGPTTLCHTLSENSSVEPVMDSQEETSDEGKTNLTKGQDSESASCLSPDRNQNHKDSDICKVCYDAKINSVLIRCGHMAVCMDCSQQLETCPICRMEITDVIQIYKV